MKWTFLEDNDLIKKKASLQHKSQNGLGWKGP